MNAGELKKKYFDFFKSKGHAVIPSASLIPSNDASVLFNTAGMQPLVPFLLGQKHPLGKRLVSLQKCLRTVDFDNIGDNIHHTFFQMLGNWSLGDYFKKEAITWSFEFLTDSKWLNISIKRLAVTVYEGDKIVPRDEESYTLWRSLGVPEKRVAFLGKDNFWIAGETGPCGPSSEIFYWTGIGEAPEVFDPNDNNWVEIWNDVFMSYNKLDDGHVAPLIQKNVDTGMGLERTLAILNGKKSAYETDLFSAIIDEIESISGKKYGENLREMRIIADHIRAIVFVLGDENVVLPSNVDRGYILRRLIRRAARYGKMLGVQNLFLKRLAEVVVLEYYVMYPELGKNAERIYSELQKEEEKFQLTLEKGLHEFDRMVSQGLISGVNAFLLFQSYGFPLEMTEELAREKGLNVDLKGFNIEFEKHQELSRAGAEKKFKGGLGEVNEQTIKYHTATHLLAEALRRIISKEIKQRGSNITPERLRFDFNFDRKLTLEEIKKVEDEVNRVIGLELAVKREEMDLEKALKRGAQAEFGVKYPPKVSVYFIGDYSKEVCGGPHVENTKQIGKFKIVKEESVAAGIRRIKAVVE
ncbi:alanine--tRNA ligase [Candidatus Woesearchaeota archaeon]|nr:alanine--tRNA ligase [Candidatus Woesearchaeota archaeon]